MEERIRIRFDTDSQPDTVVRFHVAIRMLLPARKVKEARSTLASLVERIKVKEGCLGCRLYREAMGGKVLLFEVVWEDEQSLQAHLRSAEFRYVLLVMEMARIAPEIRFDRIARTTTINTVEDLMEWTDGPSATKDLSAF